MSFPRYPKYKDSGVEWLGEVPEGWEVLRIGYLEKSGSDFVTGPFGSMLGASDYIVDGIPVIRGLNTALSAEYRFVEDNFVYVSRSKFEELSRCDAKPGDLIITARGTVGKVGIVPSTVPEALISPNQLRYRPDNSRILADYFFYVFSSEPLQKEVGLIANSVAQPNLNLGNLKSIKCPLPCILEQKGIAAFLDRETAKIDALVAEQENLIALLKEKRQAVISHAVTKGLDPTVPMKDSGIEWLGEVPAHWQVLKLTKCITSIVDYRGKTPTKVDDGVFLLTARNIRNGSIDYEVSQEFVSEDEYEEVMRRGIPTVGDLLLTMEAPLGQVANVDRTDIAIAQRIIKLQGAANTTNNYYLKWWFMGTYSQAQLSSLATGSTALGLKASKLGQLDVCLPPSDEQRHVVMFLDTETAKLDDLTTEAQHTIDLLKERRSALISAAVTGKIDVRGYHVHSQPIT